MTKLYRLAALPVAAVALLATGAPAHASTFGSLHCDSYTNTHNRVLKLCAQVEEYNGFVHAGISVHCLNGATPRQEYSCPWVIGGEISLYRGGLLLLPQSSLNCGNGYAACAAPQNGYSLNDPNQLFGQTYRAAFRADDIQTADSDYVNLTVWSGTATGV